MTVKILEIESLSGKTEEIEKTIKENEFTIIQATKFPVAKNSISSFLNDFINHNNNNIFNSNYINEQGVFLIHNFSKNPTFLRIASLLGDFLNCTDFHCYNENKDLNNKWDSLNDEVEIIKVMGYDFYPYQLEFLHFNKETHAALKKYMKNKYEDFIENINLTYFNNNKEKSYLFDIHTTTLPNGILPTTSIRGIRTDSNLFDSGELYFHFISKSLLKYMEYEISKITDMMEVSFSNFTKDKIINNKKIVSLFTACERLLTNGQKEKLYEIIADKFINSDYEGLIKFKFNLISIDELAGNRLIYNLKPEVKINI